MSDENKCIDWIGETHGAMRIFAYIHRISLYNWEMIIGAIYKRSVNLYIIGDGYYCGVIG